VLKGLREKPYHFLKRTDHYSTSSWRFQGHKGHDNDDPLTVRVGIRKYLLSLESKWFWERRKPQQRLQELHVQFIYVSCKYNWRQWGID
jgi:hypothetical protein